MQLSERAQQISPSPTLAIDAQAKKMRQEGLDVVGFGAGEPDFPTPEPIVAAAVAALREGQTRYTPASGLPRLKEAVCADYRRRTGVEYQTEQVVITCGAKHALYNLFQVLLNPGDEVILPAPYWVTYPEQIRLAGGVAVIVPTREEEGFRLQPEVVKAAITSRTRAVVLNTPNNPTGAVYPRAELSALAEIALAHNLVIIADEIYDQLIYGEAATDTVSIPSLGREVQEQTVLINGVSKTYAMTGWRIGWALAPRPLARAMADLQSHSTSNPTSFAQYGAIAALTGDQSAVAAMRAEFQARRDFMVRELNTIPGLRCRLPEGAFYTFVNLEGVLGKQGPQGEIKDSDGFCAQLLAAQRVAAVPGSGFGAPAYMRLSYATAQAQIAEGLRRIREFVAGLA